MKKPVNEELAQWMHWCLDILWGLDEDISPAGESFHFCPYTPFGWRSAIYRDPLESSAWLYVAPANAELDDSLEIPLSCRT